MSIFRRRLASPNTQTNTGYFGQRWSLTFTRSSGSGVTDCYGIFPVASTETIILSNCSLWVDYGNGLIEVACNLVFPEGKHIGDTVPMFVNCFTQLNPSLVRAAELRLSGGFSVSRLTRPSAPRMFTGFIFSDPTRLIVLPEPFRMLPWGGPSPAYVRNMENVFKDQVDWEISSAPKTGWLNRLGTIAPYEYGSNLVHMSLRTRDPKYLGYCIDMAQTFVTDSQDFAGWVAVQVQEYQNFEIESSVWLYWYTLNDDYRISVANITRRFVSSSCGNRVFIDSGTNTDSNCGIGNIRLWARCLQGFMFSIKIGANFGVSSEGGNGQTFTLDLAGLKDFYENTRKNFDPTAGAFFGTYYKETGGALREGTKFFMSCQAITFWIMYYEWIEAKSEIPTNVGTWITWEFANDWILSPGTFLNPQPTFKYVTYSGVQNGDPQYLSTTGNHITHGLNNFGAYGMSWYAVRTSDTALRANIKVMMDSCLVLKPDWFNLDANFYYKPFDEASWRIHQTGYKLYQMAGL